MKDIRQTLISIFQAEHAEHVGRIRSLLALLENVLEGEDKAKVDEVFRLAHTLKGSARVVGLGVVEGLAKGMESIFARVREGHLPLDREVSSAVREALDASDDCMAAFRENRASPDPAAALEAMDRVLKNDPPAAVETPVPPPDTPAPIVAQDPSRNDTPAPAPLIEMVRLPGQDLDRLVRSTGQILAGSVQQKSLTTEILQLRRNITTIESEWTRFQNEAAVALHRLEKMPEFSSVIRYMQGVQQKVHGLAGETRNISLLQQRSAWRMHTSAEQLQWDVWAARLAPVKDLFEGFRRMVRDLAREEKKEIDFHLTGEEVRADRAVLQALKDPLMHLLRNAISHGMETPAERTGKGKSAVGSLTLRISAQRGRLELEVDDDGRGVDLQAVARVAEANGVVPPGATAGYGPEELERLIFQPGFSTSPAVNDLSGRGMGLSVVYETVRRLQGEVTLRRKNSPGASIVLSVPLSVSHCHVLLVSVQGQMFGVPAHGIQRLYRVKAQQIETVEGKPVVHVGGSQLPLFSLARLLRIGEGPAVLEGVLPVMVLRSGGKQAAVLADEFVAGRDALIQDLGVRLPSSGFLAGGMLLREGAVVVVLNPAALVESAVKPSTPSTWVAKPSLPKRAASILVVDDSITARSLEKYILEANGFKVRVAVDGEEGLRLARAAKPDLIITDIQMPNLDGYGLLEALKADENLRGVPVVMISSLELAAEQQRGMDLGASAYIVKRKFDQQELLDTIRKIL